MPARLTADPLLRDERLTRSVDALVAAGDCVAAAATLVPAVENLRETPLRNAVLAYLAILRGRATEAEVRLRAAWDIVNPERDPGHRRVDRPAVRAAFADPLPRRRTRRLGRSRARTGRPRFTGRHRVGRDPRARTVGGRPSQTCHRGLRRPQRVGSATAHRRSASPWAAAGCSSSAMTSTAPASSLESAVAAAGLGGSTTNHVVGVGLAGARAVRRRRVGPGDEHCRARPCAGDHRAGSCDHTAAGVDRSADRRAARRLARGRVGGAQPPIVGHPGLRDDADPDPAGAGADRRGGSRLRQGSTAGSSR